MELMYNSMALGVSGHSYCSSEFVAMFTTSSLFGKFSDPVIKYVSTWKRHVVEQLRSNEYSCC